MAVRPRAFRGFTLVEMVVVVALVGILAVAAQPVWVIVKRRGDELTLRQNLRLIRGAIDAYKTATAEHHIAVASDASGYPPSLDVLVAGVADAAASAPRRLYFLRRMPRDPFADAAMPAADTWGLRSYQSSAEAPAPGRDVFDVYSTSPGTALDGSAYRTW